MSEENNEVIQEIEQIEAVPEKSQKQSALDMFKALQQSESAQANGVTVYRFTSQRFDNAAPKNFLGFYEMSPNLEQEIKTNHGGGVYFLQLRDNGSIVTTTKLTIAGKPINEETTQGDTENDKVTESVVINQSGGFGQLKEMIGVFAQMQKLFPTQQGTPPPQDDFEDKLDKLASFQAKIQNLAPPQTGTTGWDLIGKFVDKVPDILANVSTLMPLIGQTPITSTAAGIIQTPNGNVIMPANNPTNTPPANNSPMNLFSILIGQLIELIQTNDDVQAGVALCQKFYADYPAARPILDGFLNLNPTLLMTMLKANPATRELAALPQAAVYLADLFRMYKEEKEKGAV